MTPLSKQLTIVSGFRRGSWLTAWIYSSVLANLWWSAVYAQVPQPGFDWARRAGGSHYDAAKGVALGPSGMVYVLGDFSEPNASFGGTNLTSQGGIDVFIAKYNCAGDLIWTRQAGGGLSESAGGIAVDPQGNIYISGTFWSSVLNLGETSLTNTGGTDAFIAKYDSSGNLLWAANPTGKGAEGAWGIVANSAGECFVTGTFQSSQLAFGDSQLTLTNTDDRGDDRSADIFVAKYDALGRAIWASGGGGKRIDDNGTGIALDSRGYCYAAGLARGQAVFGDTTLDYGASEGPYILLFDPGGKMVRAQKGGIAPGGYGASIAVDAGFNVYLTGAFSIKADFGPFTLINHTNLGQSDVFITKYDPAGEVMWARQAGGNEHDYGQSIALDGFGNIYVAGAANPGADFGGIFPTGGGGDFDIFLTKLNSAGAFLWAEKAGGAGIERCWGIAVDEDGDCFVAGEFEQGARFGTTSLVSAGQQDIFVGKRKRLLPVITVQPKSLSLVAGATASFSLGAASAFPLGFQWVKDGLNLTRQTNATLTLTNVLPAQAGAYQVAVSNYDGVVLSSPAVLDVRFFAVLVQGQVVSNASASFVGSATIELQTAFPRGNIFYTLDGSQPTFESSRYTGPFLLRRTAQLRAIAYSSDFSQSGVPEPITIVIVPVYSLSTSTAGGGLISVVPAGSVYTNNQAVTVSASPSPGWRFLGWIGDLSGSNTSVNLRITGNLCVEAVFGSPLASAVTGSGSVSLFPQATLYPYGTVVRVSARPMAGNYFGAWGDHALGNANPLSFVVTNPLPTISCLFAPLSADQMAFTAMIKGHGKVSTSPAGNRFARGQSITLKAIPDAEESFLGWGGDFDGTQSSIVLVMDRSKIVTANFTARPGLAVRSCDGSGNTPEFMFVLHGDLNQAYRIEVSSDLAVWAPSVVVTNYLGTVQVSDPWMAAPARRFYRAGVEP